GTRARFEASAASGSVTAAPARDATPRPGRAWTFRKSGCHSSRWESGSENSSTAEPDPGGVKRLWAPWRMSYVGASKTPSGCVFCEALSGSDDRKSLVLARRDCAFLILHLFPYAPGHLRAVSTRHVATPAEAAADEIAAAVELVTLATRILTAEYRAEGFNVGLNQGRVAGAGIGDHLELHIVL